MTTKEKITLLASAMEAKARDNGSEYYCFTDTVPKKLKNLFLENYRINDLDYDIFNCAISKIVEAWEDNKDVETLFTYIEDNYNDFASIYTTDRLGYLNVWNDSEVADIFKDGYCTTISDACALWYDLKVTEAISLITCKYLN